MAPIDASSMTGTMKLNNRDWPVLSVEAEWELVDSNHAMAMVAFPEENSEAAPLTWAARLLGAHKVTQIPTDDKMSKVFKEKMVEKISATPPPCVGGPALEDPELPDPKELAREARSKQVAKGCGQTMRSNTQCQWVTVVAQEDEDTSHLHMLRKAPVREKGSGKCQIKEPKGKTTKNSGQEKDGKDSKIKVQEHPQSKKQTNRIDIREGLNIMGFA